MENEFVGPDANELLFQCLSFTDTSVIIAHIYRAIQLKISRNECRDLDFAAVKWPQKSNRDYNIIQ